MTAFPTAYGEGCSCIQLTQVSVSIVLHSVRFDQTLKSVNQMEQSTSHVEIGALQLLLDFNFVIHILKTILH